MICLGIDTSNYTTSVALYESETQYYDSERKLLAVPEGSLGLRQSDAVFQHTVQLPQLTEALFKRNSVCPDVISVSVRPSEEEGSYMPCFLTGESVARSIASAIHVPIFSFSHQAGHIAATLFSAKQESIICQPFYAFHLSGGTTDVLLVEPDPEKIFHISKIGGSLDLKAGQAIDRVGKMLGLSFPAGKALDELSRSSTKTFHCKPYFNGNACSFSGVENQCRMMLQNREAPEDIANYCLSYISTAIERLTDRITQKNTSLPVVYSGGVSGNSMLRQRLSKKYHAVFAQDGLASDNAVGVAWLGAHRR